MFGNLSSVLTLASITLLEQNGYIETSKMSMVKSSETKHVLWLKDILKLKELTSMKHLLLLLGLKLFAYC